MDQNGGHSGTASASRWRRRTIGQSEMGGHLKYDDDDDYGIPKLTAQTRRPVYIRYRNHVLIAACILMFFLWSRMGDGDQTDWSRFAYVQYATDSHAMCNAFMVFEALHRLGSKADRVLLYPDEWTTSPNPKDRNSELLARAKKLYGVQLKPIQLLGLDGEADAGTMKQPSGFETSITKLRIWELDEYERIIHFDADVILNQHLDELLMLPPTPIAMPRDVVGSQDGRLRLSTQLMVLVPDAAETKTMWETLQTWRLDPWTAEEGDEAAAASASRHYDIELINDRFGASAMVLPHRPYLMQSSEFRRHDHTTYMGLHKAPETAVQWDAFRQFKEAKLIHFDDWPLPKPWVMWPIDGLVEIQPDCDGAHGGTCLEREMWKGLYEDFRIRRKDHCKILSVPAPKWEDWKNNTGAGGV